MKAKEFVMANLGKSLTFKSVEEWNGGMIVGYCKDNDGIIISFTDLRGWGFNCIEEEDVILLHSPLNVTLLYIYLDGYKTVWEVE